MALDGNLYFDVNRSAKERVNKFPIIYLTSTFEKLILQVFDILISRGYSPSLKKPHKGKRDKNPKHRVVIYRKSDVFRFVEKDIGFSNPKHLLKWEFFKKYGYYIPNISYEERKRLLKLRILFLRNSIRIKDPILKTLSLLLSIQNQYILKMKTKLK